MLRVLRASARQPAERRTAAAKRGDEQQDRGGDGLADGALLEEGLVDVDRQRGGRAARTAAGQRVDVVEHAEAVDEADEEGDDDGRRHQRQFDPPQHLPGRRAIDLRRPRAPPRGWPDRRRRRAGTRRASIAASRPRPGSRRRCWRRGRPGCRRTTARDNRAPARRIRAAPAGTSARPWPAPPSAAASAAPSAPAGACRAAATGRWRGPSPMTHSAAAVSTPKRSENQVARQKAPSVTTLAIIADARRAAACAASRR